jgi:hypothetical protein
LAKNRFIWTGQSKIDLSEDVEHHLRSTYRVQSYSKKQEAGLRRQLWQKLCYGNWKTAARFMCAWTCSLLLMKAIWYISEDIYSERKLLRKCSLQYVISSTTENQQKWTSF